TRLSRSSATAVIPITAVFMVLVVLAFSDEFLGAFDEEMELRHRWDWLLAPIDLVILALVLLTKNLFRRRIGGAKRPSVLVWWFVGAILTLALDLLTTVVIAPRIFPRDLTRLWLDLLTPLPYLVALALILSTTLDARPAMLVSRRARESDQGEWVRLRTSIPLLAGTLAAYYATTWWEYQLGGDVDKEFFAQMTQVIVLLIVALGLEVGFFREAATDPGQRPVVVFAVFILSLGEVMALSALVPSEHIFGWHVYAAFVIVVEASLVALATMLWVLLFRTPRPLEPAPHQVITAGTAKAPTTQAADKVKPLALVGLGFGLCQCIGPGHAGQVGSGTYLTVRGRCLTARDRP
ncbi:hypothetical protein, partial [Amycolatopsis lurida]